MFILFPATKGYLKTNFQSKYVSKNYSYGAGIIMDEEFKVDLRILQFKEEDSNQFSVGDHVQVIAAVTENKGIFS